MKLYICGAMSGIKDHNFPAFFSMEEKLQGLGYETENPATQGEETSEKPWEYFLKRDIPLMLGCDAILVLDGWKQSKGASLEVKTALAVNMKIFELEDRTLVEVSNKGMKFDSVDKLRWDLVPWEIFEETVAVLTDGANKYEDNNWKHVENGSERYFGALLRHVMAYRNGELLDPESGRSHLSHAMCNLLFLLWFDKEASEEDKAIKFTPEFLASIDSIDKALADHRLTVNNILDLKEKDMNMDIEKELREQYVEQEIRNSTKKIVADNLVDKLKETGDEDSEQNEIDALLQATAEARDNDDKVDATLLTLQEYGKKMVNSMKDENRYKETIEKGIDVYKNVSNHNKELILNEVRAKSQNRSWIGKDELEIILDGVL